MLTAKELKLGKLYQLVANDIHAGYFKTALYTTNKQDIPKLDNVGYLFYETPWMLLRVSSGSSNRMELEVLSEGQLGWITVWTEHCHIMEATDES